MLLAATLILVSSLFWVNSSLNFFFLNFVYLLKRKSVFQMLKLIGGTISLSIPAPLRESLSLPWQISEALIASRPSFSCADRWHFGLLRMIGRCLLLGSCVIDWSLNL